MECMPQKLLLADDSVTIQRVIELTFADEDVQVVAVGNGRDAIERVQRDRPDIVLADIGMPERNGYEVAAFVKGNPATAHIPVVLLTGAFEPIDEGRAREVGCDGVLVKPFEPQVVISRVKDLLAGKKPSGMWSASPVAQGPSRPGSADLEMRSGGGQATAAADPLEAYFDRLDAAFASTAASTAPDPFAAAPPAAPAASADPFAGTGAAPKRETIPLARPAAPAKPARSADHDPLASWDPDLAGDPARPAPPAPTPAPPRAAAPPVQPPASPPAPIPLVPPPVAARPAVAAPQPVAATSAPPEPPSPPAAATPAAAALSLVDAFAALLAAEERIGLKPSAATMPSPAPSAPAEPQTLKIDDDLIEEITARVLVRLTDASRPTILDVAERLVREEIERIKQG
jgi:CheY-like chemotaxis protein